MVNISIILSHSFSKKIYICDFCAFEIGHPDALDVHVEAAHPGKQIKFLKWRKRGAPLDMERPSQLPVAFHPSALVSTMTKSG